MRTWLLGFLAAATTLAAATHVGVAPWGEAGHQGSTGEVHSAETLAIVDLSDDRRMVGLAEDVFLGTVVREQGTTTTNGLLETQYEVTVVHPIKGGLRGSVVVSQAGGIDENGDTFLVDDDALLEAGHTYLLAARTNPETGWHTLVPRYGTLPADSTAGQAGLTTRFEHAEAAQVEFTPTT